MCVETRLCLFLSCQKHAFCDVIRELNAVVKLIGNQLFLAGSCFRILNSANSVNMCSEKEQQLPEKSCVTYQCLEYETLLVVFYMAQKTDTCFKFETLKIAVFGISPVNFPTFSSSDQCDHFSFQLSNL